MATHCSGTYSWGSSKSAEPIPWLPPKPFGGFVSREGCGVAPAAGARPWVGTAWPRLQVWGQLWHLKAELRPQSSCEDLGSVPG